MVGTKGHPTHLVVKNLPTPNGVELLPIFFNSIQLTSVRPVILKSYFSVADMGETDTVRMITEVNICNIEIMYSIS